MDQTEVRGIPKCITNNFTTYKEITIFPIKNTKCRVFELACPTCNTTMVKTVQKLYADLASGTHQCDSCNLKALQPTIAKVGKTTATTSGYKGVFLYRNGTTQNIVGYETVISSKGKKILRHRIPFSKIDTRETALIKCAIIRDKFIIAHNLPQYRNFTDKQLANISHSKLA